MVLSQHILHSKLASQFTTTIHWPCYDANLIKLRYLICSPDTPRHISQCEQVRLLLYCPCPCCHSGLWYYVVFLSGSKYMQIYICKYMQIYICKYMQIYICKYMQYMQIFNRLFISVLPFQIQLSREEGCDPTNQFKSATCLCLFQVKTWIFNVICRGFFYVQLFEVKGGRSFCWYSWNCWPSLFKLSFHNSITRPLLVLFIVHIKL